MIFMILVFKFSIIALSIISIFKCQGSSDSNDINYFLLADLMRKKPTAETTFICADVKCTSNPNAAKTAGIFEVLSNTQYVTVNGTFNQNSCKNFQTLLKSYCGIKTIIMLESGGSIDDKTTLALGKLVHRKKLNIHLAKYQSDIEQSGLISSGAVDFFLAGKQRTRGQPRTDAAQEDPTGNEYGQFGVHAWGVGDLDAYDIRNKKDDSRHKPYIEYYKSIGFSQTQSEDFYFFTISKARASGMHYMLETEIIKYNMLTDTTPIPIKIGDKIY